jgi:hypothetical protein
MAAAFAPMTHTQARPVVYRTRGQTHGPIARLRQQGLIAA